MLFSREVKSYIVAVSEEQTCFVGKISYVLAVLSLEYQFVAVKLAAILEC